MSGTKNIVSVLNSIFGILAGVGFGVSVVYGEAALK
jgi:hypothetical protein